MARPKSTNVFLDALRDAGGSSSNPALIARLDWDAEKYEKIRAELFESGAISRGKGKGGTVTILNLAHSILEQDEELVDRDDIDDSYSRELDLYEPMGNALSLDWQKKYSLDEFHIERTALLGKRETGGSWSRPDLVVIGAKKYEFLRDRVFELHTFEIKPFTDVTIKGVLEALAHRESATRSYVVYHTNGADFTSFPEHSRIAQLAARHGVGVFAAKNAQRLSDWIEIVSAQRANPDLDSLEAFIRVALTPEAKTKIRKWF